MTEYHSQSAAFSSGKVVARFPATPNQRRYWREIVQEPEDPRLNIVYRRRFVGRISDEAIASAMQTLVDRHEILRTLFHVGEDGVLYQEVLEHFRFKLDHVDLRTLPEGQRQAELLRLGGAAARTPFTFAADRSETPLFGALLIRVSAEEAHLHLIFHHLVIDGWSLDLVVREIGTLAFAADAGREADLPHINMHFGDYARWQTDLVTGDALDADRSYWKDKLSGLPDFRVTPDREGTPEGKPSEIRSILLPNELSNAFEDLAKRTNHTLFSLASAAAATSLHYVTGTSEVVVGTQMAGREDPDSEAIIGPLINTVLLRMPTPRGCTFAQVAENARTNIREAMAHQLVPFAEIDQMIGRSRDKHIPPYRVNLVVQRTYISSATVHDSSYGSFKIESVAAPSVGALWDLSLFMVGRAEGWRLSCEFPPDLYDSATIDALLDGWRGAMEKAVKSPEFLLDGHRGELEPAGASTGPGENTERSNPRVEALRTRVLALQPKGEATPVVAINNVSVLYPVAKAIGEDHPFYDIQFCPSSTPVDLPYRHFTDYARDAVEMIRLARPHGPYILFGLCVMGAVAIEAARILQSEGEEVELVVLNDTYRPGYRENLGSIQRFLRHGHVELVAARKLWRRYKAGEVNLRHLAGKLFKKIGILRIAKALGGDNANLGTYDAVADGNRWFIDGALTESQGKLDFTPYRGRVVMFRNMDMPDGRYFPHDFGWEGFVDGEFEVVMCPGNHDTMFRPEGAKVIGATIRRIVDRPD